MLLVTNSIAGCGKLKPYCRRNIAGIYFVKLCPLVCVHLQDTSDTLLLVLRRIVHIGTRIAGTGVHTEERQLTHEGVCHNLECKGCERLVIGGMSHDLIAFHIRTLDCLDISRRRHILKDCIQKLLHALISVSGTAAYGNCRTFAGTFAQRFLHVFYGRLFTLQIHHCQIIVQLADLLHQLVMIECSIIRHIGRNLRDGDIIALIIIVDVSLHLEQVDDSLEVILLTDG